MELIVDILAFSAIGIIVGVFSGLLGIGGGTLMVPALRLGFGLSAWMATATSLFTIIPTSLAGTLTHIRNKTCYLSLGAVLGCGGALSSPVGVYLASLSPSWLIMLVTACIIVYSAYHMFSRALKLPKTSLAAFFRTRRSKDKSRTQDALADQQPLQIDFPPDPEFSFKSYIAAFFIGMSAGLASGYAGVGGGFVMVPMMTALLGVPMYKASGTSLVAIIILAIPGVVEQIFFGNVAFLAGICFACGSIPGAIFGARLVVRIPERALRLIFAVFLTVMALFLVINELFEL